MHHFIANNADADILYISAHGHYDRKKNLAGIIIGDQFLISIDFPWTFANLCGTVVYCKGGAKMAQISLEELYRGEGAGETHGILGEYVLRHTFATMALEHGMDVKTLSATIGHVSSATTLDIYSHITDTMQRQAAVHIDRKIGGTDARMPTMKREERKDTAPVEFTPYKPKIRKPGTGCVTMINDHLYEGRYTPTNAYGKRESHNIYAKTREECEEKLAEMIVQVKAQIKAEKEKMTG